MTQEEIDLVIEDLSARIPHRKVKLAYSTKDNPECLDKIGEIIGVDIRFKRINFLEEHGTPIGITPSEYAKPILRKMSSMTEEEKIELNNIPSVKNYWIDKDDLPWDIAYYKQLNWLYSKGFDIRGLIENNLAIEQ